MITITDIQIFIITHNRAIFLEESINCLLRQTAGIKEITVLDNESTDNTEEIVKKYLNKGVKYKKTFGNKANYFISVEMSSKLYTLIFHDDDLLNESYLESAIEILNKHKNISFITTRYTEFTSDIKPDIRKKEIEKNYYLFQKQSDFATNMYFFERIAFCSCIFKTELLKNNSFEFEKYGKFFDWPYLVKLSEYGSVVLFNDIKMLYVRIHTGQWTNDKTSMLTANQIINWDKCFYDALHAGNIYSFIHYMYIEKFKHFIYGKYDIFFPDSEKNNFSKEDILMLAEKSGIKTSGNPLIDRIFKIKIINRISHILFIFIAKRKNLKKLK
ncbi:MAG: glycosyltransferase [Bacteroidaceae bacterium]|nr:glycosyltransferase [Bacteroidaceae bacterium]